LLQIAQPLAQARYRHALFDGRAPEIAGAGHGDEGFEITQDIVRHCSKQ
jgi:hypothetical protein